MVALFAALSSAAWTVGSVSSQEKKSAPPNRNVDLSEFMRKKLEASNQILEGLVMENADLVKKGAHTLTEMSSAEKWRVSTDVIYKQFSEEFQRTAKKLEEAAEKGNFDDVALKWIDATMSCVDCHKFVRGMRIATKRP